MAEVSITIPNGQLQRVLNGFAVSYGYQDVIEGQPNPQTKAQFLKATVIKIIKDAVKSAEAQTAASAARDAVHQDVDGNLTLS